MTLVDTHCHLDLPDFTDDLDEVISRAGQAEVNRIIVPGIDLDSSRRAVEIAGRYDSVFTACGIHPHAADSVTPRDIDKLRRLVTESDKVVAIGEVGLDNYRGYSDPEKQKDLFAQCLGLANELDLPLIVHCRNAEQDVTNVLRGSAKGFLRGVAHCFSGGETFLRDILSLGLFVSFAGNITFPRAENLRSIASKAGINNVLLETDAPYMAPRPHRGRRNEPSFLGCLTPVYRELFGLSESQVARETSRNADELFHLGLEGVGKAVYGIRDSLYINMTHRCTNRCGFCARQVSKEVKGHDLSLGAEPSRKEMQEAIGDPKQYKEIVFCGFGEPTLRIGAVKEVAAYVKERGGKVRINTNGQANLICGRDVTPELERLVDKVSVSINSPDAAHYNELCRPVFGEKAYQGIRDFIFGCASRGIETEVTCLDHIGEEAIQACRAIGAELGAGFRLRHLDRVG